MKKSSAVHPSKRKGFTLVELLVVIAIIAILSVIGITVFSGVQKNARDAKRKADLHAIALALEQYKLATGDYPTTGPNGSGSPSFYLFYSYPATTNPWITGLNSDYMVSVPADPINNGSPPTTAGNYSYLYNTADTKGCSPAGGCFHLGARLENPSAADLATKCTTGTKSWSANCGGDPDCYGLPGLYLVCQQQ